MPHDPAAGSEKALILGREKSPMCDIIGVYFLAYPEAFQRAHVPAPELQLAATAHIYGMGVPGKVTSHTDNDGKR